MALSSVVSLNPFEPFCYRYVYGRNSDGALLAPALVERVVILEEVQQLYTKTVKANTVAIQILALAR
jgi:hypothetical protein